MRQKNICKKKALNDVTKKNESQFKKGDKIYLLINNLRIKRPSKKLNYRKINLFFIKIIRKFRNTK